jgi:hypothetical protein
MDDSGQLLPEYAAERVMLDESQQAAQNSIPKLCLCHETR